jgi:hypothetical protein
MANLITFAFVLQKGVALFQWTCALTLERSKSEFDAENPTP